MAAADLQSYMAGKRIPAMTYQASQADLFSVEPDLPTGFQYEAELVSSKEEQRLIEQFTKFAF